MFRPSAIAVLFTPLLLVPQVCRARPQAEAPAVPAPSDEELQQRGLKLIANQHKDDEALDKYERIEHELDSTGGATPRILIDKKTRLVPNGAGTTKLLLEEGGRRVTLSQYRSELENWANVLEFMVNPNDERNKSATAKYAKRRQSRSDLVDSMLTAFERRWLGRQMREGRECDVIELQPDRSFHPKSLLEEALTHAAAKIWVDREALELVHAEVTVTSDFSVGGGVLGKLYKGGTFSMDQAEVAPGLWLPTRYQFDFSGRKFFFSFEQHQSIEASHYRYIGSPEDALPVVRSELANPTPLAGDP